MEALFAEKIQSGKGLQRGAFSCEVWACRSLVGLVPPGLPAGPGLAAGEQFEFREAWVGGFDQLVDEARFLGVASSVGFDHGVGSLLGFGEVDLAAGCEQEQFVAVACPV